MPDIETTADTPATRRSRWFWVRVATSVFFGLMTVAIVVLWVRSYLLTDYVAFSWPDRRHAVMLGYGEVEIFVQTSSICPWHLEYGSTLVQNQDTQLTKSMMTMGFGTLGNTGAIGSTSTTIYRLPIWLVASLTASTAYLIWTVVLPRSLYRFSLRTMLTITTLVAVVMGLVVWMVR